MADGDILARMDLDLSAPSTPSNGNVLMRFTITLGPSPAYVLLDHRTTYRLELDDASA